MIPIISSGLRIMVSFSLFFISNIAFILCVNFNFINSVLWVPPSIILIIANPQISLINGALTFTNFCSSGFNIISFSGWMVLIYSKIQNDNLLSLLLPLTQRYSLCLGSSLHSHESWIPMCKFQIYVHVYLQ